MDKREEVMIVLLFTSFAKDCPSVVGTAIDYYCQPKWLCPQPKGSPLLKRERLLLMLPDTSLRLDRVLVTPPGTAAWRGLETWR